MRRTFQIAMIAGATLSLMPAAAFAATLSFSPRASTVSVGQLFTVAVDVSSPSQAMNAVSSDISFPTNNLRVLSVSNDNSVMNLWVQNPSFSNTTGAGDINFAGVVLNPGFTGNLGNVVTIQFKAVGVGDAPLSFSNGSVLANDGNGTEILTSMGTADITVTPAAPPAIASTSTPTSTVILPPSATSTTACPTSTTQVMIEGPPPGSAEFLLAWAAILLLALLLLAALIALGYYLVHHLRRFHISLNHRLNEERRKIHKGDDR